ncbi:TetR family transcriptional regulator [Pseudonocardia sp. HH130630-07]|nr:TetR family transcriptional regulator [Pseudonocardia sp. HH130630-07]
MTRAETAARTRRTLVRSASELLDEGGPEAVTLRAVGARAGVSRGAPYGHFTNKEHLLARLAVDTWHALADDVEALGADPGLDTGARLERAVVALIDLARARPHHYALMFSAPVVTEEAADGVRRLEDAYLTLVAELVGEPDATRYAALLMCSAHGIAGMELSGHLAKGSWQVGAEQLVRMLVEDIRRGRDVGRGG